jgi:molybdopterin biosynthesis enzyme
MPTIDFDEALRTALSTAKPLPPESVALDDAFGRVAAAARCRYTEVET